MNRVKSELLLRFELDLLQDILNTGCMINIAKVKLDNMLGLNWWWIALLVECHLGHGHVVKAGLSLSIGLCLFIRPLVEWRVVNIARRSIAINFRLAIHFRPLDLGDTAPFL